MKSTKNQESLRNWTVPREIKKTEDKLLKQEQRIEKKKNKILTKSKNRKVLFRIGSFEFKRKHLLELIKGVAGAFSGVGLGRST